MIGERLFVCCLVLEKERTVLPMVILELIPDMRLRVMVCWITMPSLYLSGVWRDFNQTRFAF